MEQLYVGALKKRCTPRYCFTLLNPSDRSCRKINDHEESSYVILVTLLVLSFFMADALALNVIPLYFSYSPIELGHVYWLPNGSYLVEYFRLNTSEFWHNLGRDDIRRHVTEIFASSGQSVFCCTEGEEIFPEKIDDYLFQYAVYPDSFLREMQLQANWPYCRIQYIC